MPSSSFVGAVAAAAISSGASSTLSPNAAPYTLLARQGRAPPGCLQDGDASRVIDDNSVLNGEVNNAYSASLATHFGMKPSDAVYPSNAHGMRQSQPSSSRGSPASVYLSPSSSVSESSVAIASNFNQGRIPMTSGRVTVTIRSPPNKTSETDNTSFGSSKLSIWQNDEFNKETGKVVSCGNLELSNPTNGNGTSQGTMVFSKELNPEVSVKPHGPSVCASPCVTVADDVNPDPSECSVDSPCWRGTASRPSPFDVHQTLVAQSVKQESVAFDAGQEQSFSTDCEAPTKLPHLVASKSKQNHPQSHAELGLSKKPGDIGTNLTHDSHEKELEFVKHGAAKCNAEKHCLEMIDDDIKRSGLNSAAPDFIPLSVRKSNSSSGSCSSGTNISGILRAIKSMSEVLCNNYSDEIELEEHDYSLLQSVIENLQSYLSKAKKVPVKGISDKAGGLKACYSQNAVSKSVTRNYNGSYTADNGKGIIISNIADSSRLLGELRKKCATGYQPSLNNFPKELSCEEDHSQALIYKNLWIDAERANCALKYQLKQTRLEIDLESSRAHIGGGPRIPPFHQCDPGRDLSSSCGSAITSPLMLKDNPGGRKSHNLLYAADRIQSGDNSVLSRSKGHITVPNSIEDEYFLSGLEETGVHPHAHSGVLVAPSRAHRGLDARTSDGLPSLSHITGSDGILL
ncbi:hypothetical protein PAHAL_6G039800 [Panicum hallii]|uniref:Uncharacterized protein n=1 Tax=Panicum hallii TaxID=206008 RepID=A0A2S3I0D8_9POAL|nr:uncharacterized protein LOC112897144 [Panicum hallii]PAN33711.1 hypothetical protein PAHAL_6G039800 [Panicum hallii]